MVLFDGAVQHCPNKAIRLLQEGLGVDIDGVVGPRTLKAARYEDHVLQDVIAARLVYYASLGNKKFLKGWFRRMADLAMKVGSKY